jgi:hypothetical protein
MRSTHFEAAQKFDVVANLKKSRQLNDVVGHRGCRQNVAFQALFEFMGR